MKSLKYRSLNLTPLLIFKNLVKGETTINIQSNFELYRANYTLREDSKKIT